MRNDYDDFSEIKSCVFFSSLERVLSARHLMTHLHSCFSAAISDTLEEGGVIKEKYEPM